MHKLASIQKASNHVIYVVTSLDFDWIVVYSFALPLYSSLWDKYSRLPLNCGTIAAHHICTKKFHLLSPNVLSCQVSLD